MTSVLGYEDVTEASLLSYSKSTGKVDSVNKPFSSFAWWAGRTVHPKQE